MEKLLVIDGNSLLFRAYYATTYPGANIMKTKDGVPTNALFAFGNMINKILGNLKGNEGIIVAFDTGKKNFRHEQLETYKANRKPLPDDLRPQIPLAHDLLKALGIFTYEQDGYEGDDVAGTIAKQAAKHGVDVNIYTSDRDFLQLIDEHILVYLLKKGLSEILIVDEIELQKTWGVAPHQVPDLKGLMGDSSDNLPGIPGIGEKTAIKLINEHSTLENIINNAPKMNSKIGEKIIEHQDLGRLCKHLAIIDTNINLPFSYCDLTYQGYDFKTVADFCHRYELKLLLSKLNPKQKLVSVDKKEIIVNHLTTLNGLPIDKEIGIAIDYQEGNYHHAEIYGIAIYNHGNAYYLPASSIKNDAELRAVLEDEKISKYGFDLKAITVILHRYGLHFKGGVFDILLASYLLDSSLNSTPNAVFSFFGVDLSLPSLDNVTLFETSGNEKMTCEISHYSYSLKDKLNIELRKEEADFLFKNVEIPLSMVLAEMEIEGFPLHKEDLLAIGMEFRIRLENISQEIYELINKNPKTLNLASPKQISELLFNELGLNNPKKGSTSVDVLRMLISKHPVVPLILEHRKYAKIISTYIDGLINFIHPDGKLHAIFNQALTTTGRLSSSEPNLQNISIRDEDGKKIRKAFYYKEPQFSILSFDYSQVELRILASLAKCQRLIDIFNEDRDIHSETAKAIFRVNEVTSLQRRKAKAVNFGIVYGISDWGLSEQIGTSVQEAKMIINNFYDTYPEMALYLNHIINDATQNGYVKTLLGRRRYLREINDENYQVREFAKRAAMNAPIQGTAADLIKIAMVRIHKKLEEGNYQTKLVLQIHDELIFKVPDSELKAVYPVIKEVMENSLKLDVALKVEGSDAKTWFDTK